MHDVVIVGGRCAGAPLALQLARAGHRVLIVDRTRFPSDTMSTHFIQSPGIARLARWGLLDQVLDTNCPTITRALFVIGGTRTDTDIPLDPSLPGLAAPRRYVLDKILVDAAVAAGAELAEGVLVDSLIRDDDRVVGISGHTSEGDFEARARFVVGADGRNSVVARETGAPTIQDLGGVSAGYYSYFRNLEESGPIELYLEDGLFGVVFPTNDGLTGIGLAWPESEFSSIKKDVDGTFMAALERLGDLGQRVQEAERVERYVGSGSLPNYVRQVHGSGWALVGDAAYHKDPAPADGITDAFRAAEYLAEALDDVLSGNEDEGTALERYQQRHNEYALPLLEAAVRVARFDLTPKERFDAFFEIRMNNHSEMEQLLSSNGVS